jgi:hypothetical protein
MSSSDLFSTPSQPLPPEFDQREDDFESDELDFASAAGSHALVKRQGRPAAEPLELHIVRSLTEADLPKILNRGPTGIVPTGEVAKLRTVHHQPAQLIAQGISEVDIARITGYSQSYIAQLMNNPAFKGLVAHYSAVGEIAHVDAMKRLNALGITAMELLQERMEDSSDDFSVRELNEVVEMAIVRPATAAMKATGQVAAANAAPRSFSVAFRYAGGVRTPEGPEIDGEVVK